MTLANKRAALNQRYSAYGAKLGWDLSDLPTTTQHDGSFHIELTETVYHWVVSERGLELERHVFDTAEHLLEHIFIHLTFWAGVEYEMHHRDPTKDSRRQIFAHQLDLLAQLNAEWHRVAQIQIENTLSKHPYHDPEGG